MAGVKVVFLILGIFAAKAYSAVDEDDVKYMLYTPTYSNTPYEINLGFTQRFRTQIRKGQDQVVKVLCHGYVDNSSAIWIAPTKDAFLAQNFEFVIAVDWGKLSYGNYDLVRGRTPDVGENLARLVIEMSSNFGIPLSKFHLIGHSLGAHISGFAGKRIQESTGEKLGRITGMDPAGPGFNSVPEAERLSLNDADFVDAIHTDTRKLGYKNEIAHADFWPNGGSGQNGCGILQVGCSHNRAPAYFQESIGSNNFPAWKCDSHKNFNKGKCFENEMVLMGDNCPPTARGNYYLNTNKKSPFGIPSY